MRGDAVPDEAVVPVVLVLLVIDLQYEFVRPGGTTARQAYEREWGFRWGVASEGGSRSVRDLPRVPVSVAASAEARSGGA